MLLRHSSTPAFRPARCIGRTIVTPARIATIVPRSAFEDDPNTEAAKADEDEEPRNRPATTSGRGPQAERKTGRLRTGARGLGRRRHKPTAEELRAMGYDDVDDFEDADNAVYDRLELDENDPL